MGKRNGWNRKIRFLPRPEQGRWVGLGCIQSEDTGEGKIFLPSLVQNEWRSRGHVSVVTQEVWFQLSLFHPNWKWRIEPQVIFSTLWSVLRCRPSFLPTKSVAYVGIHLWRKKNAKLSGWSTHYRIRQGRPGLHWKRKIGNWRNSGGQQSFQGLDWRCQALRCYFKRRWNHLCFWKRIGRLRSNPRFFRSRPVTGGDADIHTSGLQKPGRIAVHNVRFRPKRLVSKRWNS